MYVSVCVWLNVNLMQKRAAFNNLCTHNYGIPTLWHICILYIFTDMCMSVQRVKKDKQWIKCANEACRERVK